MGSQTILAAEVWCPVMQLSNVKLCFILKTDKTSQNTLPPSFKCVKETTSVQNFKGISRTHILRFTFN